jgi:class 3 adenylate cyclase
VGVAAGLVVGVIGGQMTARFDRPAETPITAATVAASESAREIAAISKHDAEDSDGLRVFALDPGVVLASYREPQTSGGN